MDYKRRKGTLGSTDEIRTKKGVPEFRESVRALSFCREVARLRAVGRREAAVLLHGLSINENFLKF